MFKYKWDKMQITIVAFLIINVIALLVFPYKFNTLTETTYYGYKAFMHWVLIFYTIRLCLHIFGMEIYNLGANIVGLYVILGGSTYLKFFLGRREYSDMIYTGMIIPIVTITLFIGMLYLDKAMYTMEKREV